MSPKRAPDIPDLLDQAFEGNGNAVIYARYSSAAQQEQSIDGQLRYCYQYAASRGIRVVGEYIDRALSGTKAETRPEFQRMIQDAGKKQFQFVLVWKLDRFARNRYDSVIYKNKLKKSGVRVLSVTEGIDGGSESAIMEAILEAMAEEYSRQISQNVSRGMREAARQANTVGGTVPLGYRPNGKKLAVVESEAQIVRYIFERYAAGVGKKDIVSDINAKGWRTRFQKPFTISSLTTILRNQKYSGVYTYAGEIEVEGGCPAIVDKATFAKAQDVAARTRRAPARAKAQEEYLLAGKVFCGYCGAPMIGESGRGKGGITYHYYTCANRKKSHTCHKHNEKKHFLEGYAVDQAVEYILDPRRIDMIAERVVQEYQKEFNASGIPALESELRGVDRDIEGLVESLIKTSSPTAIKLINDKLAALEARKAAISDEIAGLKIASSVAITEDDVIRWLRSFCKGDSADYEFRKQIIDVLINSIYVFDDKIVFFFNVQGGKQVSFVDMLDVLPPETCSDFGCSGVPYGQRSKFGTQILTFFHIYSPSNPAIFLGLSTFAQKSFLYNSEPA